MNSSDTTLYSEKVHEYAKQVNDGKIVAGPYVRAAAKRHLQDMEQGHHRGLFFDEEAADRVLRFFKTVLKVRHPDGHMMPFELLPWQAFCVGSIFGWKRKTEDGVICRRFNEAYFETGKGSGKSPLAAGIGHYMFMADGESDPEIYAAATKRDQAMVLFRDAVSMMNASPALSRRIHQHGRNPVWQLSGKKKGGFFKPLSNDDSQSGPRPYCGLVDEYHEHKTADTLEMLKAGFKGRRNPLLAVITNSGSDIETPCFELHTHAINVATGVVEDDLFFSYVCAMDEGDDPLNSENVWEKGNPSLGNVIGKEYVRRAVLDAKSLPSRENNVRRLYFCQWMDAPSTWINRDALAACEVDVHLEDYAGRPCYAGLDLSYSQDLSALALAFPREEQDGFDVFVEFWKPKDVIFDHAKRDRVHYDIWAKRGFIHTPDGAVLKCESFTARLGQIQNEFDLISLAYDKYRMKDLEADLNLQGLDLPMMEHPQGFRRSSDILNVKTGKKEPYPLWMPESVRLFENGVIEKTLRFAKNPVFRWNVVSTVLREDPAGTGNHILNKKKSTGRIDGAVAACMAIGCANANASPNHENASSYLDQEEAEILFI